MAATAAVEMQWFAVAKSGVSELDASFSSEPVQAKEPPPSTKSMRATPRPSWRTAGSVMHAMSTWQVKVTLGAAGKMCETSTSRNSSAPAAGRRAVKSSITCVSPSVEAVQCSIGHAPLVSLKRCEAVARLTSFASENPAAARISRSEGIAVKRRPTRSDSAPGDTTRICATKPPPDATQRSRDASMRSAPSTSARRDTPIWLGFILPWNARLASPSIAGSRKSTTSRGSASISRSATFGAAS